MNNEVKETSKLGKMAQADREDEREKCFVIMPIGEIDTIYPKDHFKHVYEDIFCPAIEKAGFKPYRASDKLSSHMIHVDIIKEIVEAPFALCDLSTRNPNVLFELGIRQAFDKPVVLVQEAGTPRIFDISTINTIDYRKEKIYHEVIEDRQKISKAITATMEDSSYNSIIQMLKLGQANLKEGHQMNENDEIRLMLKTLTRDVSEIKSNKNILHTLESNNNIRYRNHSEMNGSIEAIENFLKKISRLKLDNCTNNTKNSYLTRARRYRDMLSLKFRDNGDIDFEVYRLLNELDSFINAIEISSFE
jgi:general stress protein 26